MVQDAYETFPDARITVMLTGSSGIAIANGCGVSFIQEVIAGTRAIEAYCPETDVAIELGGEDAKITYLTDGVEQRMNGTCAGGTGSFIDQMAVLLKRIPGTEQLARTQYHYPIALCGAFAKIDVSLC